MKLVFVSKLSKHLSTPGECVSCPIRCTICQSYISKCFFQDHFNQCSQDRLNNVLELMLRLRSISKDTNSGFVPTIMNMRNLREQQRRNLPLRTNLIGINAVTQARKRRCSHLYHIILMILFVLVNHEIGLYLVCAILHIGFITFGKDICAIYELVLRWISNHIYQGCLLIILFSSLLSYGIPLFLESVSDSYIVLCFGLMIFLLGCSSRASFEGLEILYIINDTALHFILLCVTVFIILGILWLFGFICWYMPEYLTSSLLAFINIFVVVLSLRRSRNAI
jgi:hypothetical protein